ncbi:MAG: hypothetical protein QXR60_04820, partial [Candidatus Nanoarchaeia archaeon]
PLTLAWIEAGIASYSIYKGHKQERPSGEVFFEFNKHIYDNLHSFISLPITLYYETVHEYAYKNNVDQVSFDELKSAFQHPSTISRLEELIVKDRENVFTEIPLHITLDYDKAGKPFLIFYERKTFNERNARMLLKNRDNPSFVMDFVKSNTAHYKKITNIPDKLYDKLISMFKDADSMINQNNNLKREKAQFLRKNIGRTIVDLYLDCTDTRIVEDATSLKDFYWKNFLKFKGKYVGLGHIHLLSIDSHMPSPEDIKASERLRQLIFAQTVDDLILYDVYKKNINSVSAKSLKIKLSNKNNDGNQSSKQ